MWEIPCVVSDDLKNFAQQLQCNWIGAVAVCSESAYNANCCHSNVDIHTQVYGGRAVRGWYLLTGFGVIQAIAHSVWEDPNGQLLDPTPFEDCRSYNMFARGGAEQFATHQNIYNWDLERGLIHNGECYQVSMMTSRHRMSTWISVAENVYDPLLAAHIVQQLKEKR